MTNLVPANKQSLQPVYRTPLGEFFAMANSKQGTHLVDGGRALFDFFRLERANFEALISETPIRFTPDGKQLICFNIVRQGELLVYWYNGANAVRNARGADFKTLFTRHFSVPFARFERAATLCHDLCLVTDDSAHLLVALSVQPPESSVTAGRLVRNNESAMPRVPTEHSIFLTVDLKKGGVYPALRFENESRIHSNVYMVDRLLGLLSTLHQTLYIYKLDLDGKLLPTLELGRSLYDDDHFFLSSDHQKAIGERFLLGFKQRVLTHLYKAHKEAGTVHEFLRFFHLYKSLKMQKFQFLGPELLLIRLDVLVNGTVGGDSELFGIRVSRDSNIQHYMFVLFAWRRAEVVAVLNRSSKVLFDTFVECNEAFKNGFRSANHFPDSMEHVPFLRERHAQLMMSYLSASPASEFRKRVLCALPFPIQSSYVSSPFLDPRHFSFDERTLLLVEKWRIPYEYPFQIHNRRFGHVAVQIDFTQLRPGGRPEQRPYFRVVGHPFDPLLLVTERWCEESGLFVYTLPAQPQD